MGMDEKEDGGKIQDDCLPPSGLLDPASMHAEIEDAGAFGGIKLFGRKVSS